MLRQEDHSEFEASVDNIACSKTAEATEQERQRQGERERGRELVSKNTYSQFRSNVGPCVFQNNKISLESEVLP